MASGVQDMLTTWIPLAEVLVALGGLAVRPGGHQDRPRRPRLLAGTEPGWAGTPTAVASAGRMVRRRGMSR